jgi:hypothetical protein
MSHAVATQPTPRGLTSAALAGATAPIAWKIQGTQGGEDITDPVRGADNNGGLYGERAGWSLAGYPDSGWSPVSLPDSDPDPGVAWYRTTFDLDVPAGVDSSIGLNISDPAAKLYRALIFVNGWNLGQYINNIGPQHTFVLPDGILRTSGANTLSIAVISNGAGTGGLGTVSLVDLGTVASALQVPDVASPTYQAPSLTVTGGTVSGRTVSGTIATVSVPPDALGTALAATIDWGDGASSPGVVSGSAITGSHTYAAPYAYPVKVTLSDRYGSAVLASGSRLVSVPATATGTIGATVPATLALTLGPAASFGAFAPGVDAGYDAGTTADVVSTAGDAALSVSDPSATAPGRLVNGAFALAEPLQVKAGGGPFAPLSATPLTLLSYTAPVSHDVVAIGFRQHIAADQPLRTGAYAKTLTFTLSTTTP